MVQKRPHPVGVGYPEPGPSGVKRKTPVLTAAQDSVLTAPMTAPQPREPTVQPSEPELIPLEMLSVVAHRIMRSTRRGIRGGYLVKARAFELENSQLRVQLESAKKQVVTGLAVPVACVKPINLSDSSSSSGTSSSSDDD
jgi:hypothetical protein